MKRGLGARRVACVVVMLSVAGCSGGGSKGTATKPAKASPCPLLATLDATASKVAHADVSDPDAFNKTRDAAVTTYVTTVKQLKTVLPDELRPDLDRLESAVHQYDFTTAAESRSSLDAYANEHCGTTITAVPLVTTPTDRRP